MKQLLLPGYRGVSLLILSTSLLSGIRSVASAGPVYDRCTRSFFADTIPTNFWVEDFTMADGTTVDSGATAWSVTNTSPSRNSVFEVDSNEFRANNITINGVATWTSGPIDISGKIKVSISVDARSAGGLTNDATNHADYLRMYYTIDGGSEVLFADVEGKINNNKITDTTLSVGSLNGGSTLRIIIRAKATATSEFYYFDNIKVAGATPVVVNARASVSGRITCSSTSVTLMASSTTPNVTYAWAGPGGFSSSLQNPSVGTSGIYTLTITNPEGFFATATAVVTKNTNPPSGVTAGTSDVISCYTPSILVSGTTTTPGATFSWTGPDGFTDTTASAEVGATGTYTLVVTNPSNGCTTTAVAVVVDNAIPPAGVTATNSGPLNCLNTSVTLTGSSTTPGVTYTWVAPDNHLIQGDSASISIAGTYTLVVSDPGNGCASTVATTVVQNTTGCAGSSAQARGTMSGTGAALGMGAAQELTGAGGFQYKAYPNPSGDQTFIEFKSPVSSLVTVEIYNNLGVREKILFNSTIVASQSYKLELDKGDLSPGTSFCIIRDNNKIYSVKLIRVSR